MAPGQPALPPTAPDIDLRSLSFAVLARWPLIVGLAIAGSVLGIAFAPFLPDRYQAIAEVSIGIDYSRAEFLDEDAERHILLRVQDLLLSDQVLAAAVERLPERTMTNGESPSLSEFADQIRLTRVEARWNMTVTYSDPTIAAELANAWAHSSLEAMEQSQRHALRAAELQAAFFEIACRPNKAGLWVCDEFLPGSVGDDLTGSLIQAVRASNGIAPVVSYALLSEATTPDEPVSSPRAALALSGTGLGLVVGLGVVLLTQARPGEGGGGETSTFSTMQSDASDPESEGR